ncbi:glutamyl aminopeptidase [Caerostris extrusa]|uniref:Glutamyl aminopeptidase n=1 Tax=Caerostris extrusa TaxID=172846 RepID=A0AAV4QQB5_CAEEX|nr:glutamyl aminopeptidase [Caerostris extrusa]
MDEQHPQWDTLSQFVTEELQPVMNLDSTPGLAPHRTARVAPGRDNGDLRRHFLWEGASVLRMLEFFVGENNFRAGISNFLKKYQFKNARTENLWAELSATCGLK